MFVCNRKISQKIKILHSLSVGPSQDSSLADKSACSTFRASTRKCRIQFGWGPPQTRALTCINAETSRSAVLHQNFKVGGGGGVYNDKNNKLETECDPKKGFSAALPQTRKKSSPMQVDDSHGNLKRQTYNLSEMHEQFNWMALLQHNRSASRQDNKKDLNVSF